MGWHSPGWSKKTGLSIREVIGSLTGNVHVMDMAFGKAGAGDLEKLAIALHVGDGGVACIPHGSA
jgi:hypothetical protein